MPGKRNGVIPDHEGFQFRTDRIFDPEDDLGDVEFGGLYDDEPPEEDEELPDEERDSQDDEDFDDDSQQELNFD